MSTNPTRIRFCCVMLASMLTLAPPAIAATYIVDDTSTIPYETNLVSRWRQSATGRQLGNDIEAGATVTVRLNVQPWLNRNGRIYLALPQQRGEPAALRHSRHRSDHRFGLRRQHRRCAGVQVRAAYGSVPGADAEAKRERA